MNKNESIFWTLDGWRVQPTPEIYLKAREGDGKDWDARLKEFGFEASYSGDRMGDPFEVENMGIFIYNCYPEKPDKLLLVELWNEDRSVGEFFVSDQWITIFFATWLPEFKARRGAVITARVTLELKNAVIAYIRHGHGRDTIDQYGETKDDYESRMEANRNYREMMRRKAEEEKAKKEKKP